METANRCGCARAHCSAFASHFLFAGENRGETFSIDDRSEVLCGDMEIEAGNMIRMVAGLLLSVRFHVCAQRERPLPFESLKVICRRSQFPRVHPI